MAHLILNDQDQTFRQASRFDEGKNDCGCGIEGQISNYLVRSSKVPMLLPGSYNIPFDELHSLHAIGFPQPLAVSRVYLKTSEIRSLMKNQLTHAPKPGTDLPNP